MNESADPRPLPGTEIPVYVFNSHLKLACHVANIVAAIVRERQAQGRPAVLGLPTGSRRSACIAN